ncbi:MAG TPA: CsbD family protein [Anaerolineales bacterium]|nr:CsbD family protein [Anaerolineales bacterium]
MNKDILEGNWKQIRGQIKTMWGRLTDDELDQVDGHRDRLVGLIQEKYGYTREDAEDSINEFLNQFEEEVKTKM